MNAFALPVSGEVAMTIINQRTIDVMIAQLESVERQCMEMVMAEAARHETLYPCECPEKRHLDNCPHAITDDCEFERPRGHIREAIEALEALRPLTLKIEQVHRKEGAYE
jgi:hypothetical protein